VGEEEEMLKMSLLDLDTTDTSLPMTPERLAELNAVATLEFEVGHYHKDGHIIRLEVSANLVSIGDEKFIQAFHRDITERKQIEKILIESSKKWHTTFDGMNDSILLLDVNGKILQTNKISQMLFGKKEEEMVGRQCYEIVHNSKCHIDNCPLVRMKISKQRETMLLPVGDKWFEVVVDPIFDDTMNITDVVHIIKDITERKKSEQALRQAQKMESIGFLARGIAHDFNNLLGAMMGNVSLIQLYISADHPAAKFVEPAISAMKKAATLTKQMLAYSGKGQFQMLTIDLVKMVQEHLSLIKVTIPKNVKLQMNLSPIPLYVNGDLGQIEQIILNLIINGGEAIGEKQGIVDIDVSAVKLLQDELAAYNTLTNTVLKEGEYALLRVTDNGSGMSKEIMEKIFDPFFSTKFVGRGLGLSAVLGIIRSHQGGIAIESKEGAGTTFRVLLPLVSAPVLIKETPHKKTAPKTAEEQTILVIDDEDYVVDMVLTVLELGKYQRLSAIDPVVGVKLYEEQWRTIGAVILDYSMPKMNGKEVIMALRKINPDVKVILSSGYKEEDILKLMGDSLPTSFLQKPYEANALLSMVGSVLDVK
jgi:two-component system cell cycle sensor histidine kinase/response regulator CckA